MTLKKGNKLLTELLNLEGIKVISHSTYLGIGIIFQVECINKESLCPRCETKSYRLHQNHRYIVKDLPISGQPVLLEINRRQFKCEKCQRPFSEELDFVIKRRTYTKRLAKSIIQEVLENDIHSVAKKGHVTTEEIERMLKDASSELSPAKLSQLKRLGIDEIALIKGQKNYCAVLVDIAQSKLIAILTGRTQEQIREVLTAWGTAVLEQIEEVSIDLWQGYKNLVTELMPNAQVVADRFHVMAQVNKELDTQRRQEKRHVEDLIKKAELLSEKAKYQQYLHDLKKSKYVLLKNEQDLTEKQNQQLVQVKEVSPSLKIMHELKEKLRTIFEQTNEWLSALFQLGVWLSRAKKYFPNSQQTIIRWLTEIIAYFDRRTTNGVVEGINNKIKLIKRSAYGFRNFENFRVRCLLSWHSSY